MDYEIASELVRKLKELDAPLAEAVEIVDRIDSVEERKQFRRALGYILARIYTDLLVPIGQHHPEVLPPEERPTKLDD
jgi:hypothetical protein